ncbi:Cerato-platanin-domain-containing protein [Aspergillus pseudonomiae]|uniref:Cerato-platanin-domain-containing protein n=1 Tax=Aspergillus pseudonomiae TaxID=1506151 RepID=A0A5N6HKY7_9EURO|nr:Cerato-platanin-domain-containing protein [Aspergillus pseudonomiae]KAB8254447.1 Cerato-platanin-domain-containing protein [Aspergillus pseudonomiae]KAE8404627.1 Cerato-platanin-domain-containing protein [Aspergillus pseudonomiae]
MKSFTAISLLALFSSALAAPVEQSTDASTAATVSVSYDQKYDVGGSSLTTVACSDGVYGLISQGYSTFGSVPGFPNIGGAPTIPGWNSPNCGKCYQLHYAAGNIDRSIYVTAVDAAPGGFNIGLQAMNALTNGLAEQLGRVNVDYTEVPRSNCGFHN